MLEKPGSPQEGIAGMSPVEGERKWRSSARRGLRPQHSSRSSGANLKRVCKLKSPTRRVLPSQEQPCQKQALCKHKGGFGRQQWDNASIPLPMLDPSSAFSWSSPCLTLLFQLILPSCAQLLRGWCAYRAQHSVLWWGRRTQRIKNSLSSKQWEDHFLELLADGQCDDLWLS